MPDRHPRDDAHPDAAGGTADRLRQALASRAASVHPEGGDVTALAERGEAARRAHQRRTAVLSIAALVAVVAAVGAALVLRDDDRPDEVAVGDTTTTTGPAGGPVAIWPLDRSADGFADPVAAAQSFYEEYLGFQGTCTAAGGGTVECTPCGPGADCVEPIATTVDTEDTDRGVVVTGATGSTVGIDDVSGSATSGLYASGTTRSAVPATVDIAVELRALGRLEPAASVSVPVELTGATGPWTAALAPVDAATALVLVARDLRTASVQVVEEGFSEPAPTTTTTSTTVIDDDGVPGWPGNTSRMFSDPQAAAFNFVTDVLGLAEPTLAGNAGDGADQTFTFRPRPTAGITTEIAVHDTGSVRGWVVTGVSSPEGTIESASLAGGTVTVSGSATAFEATVTVLVLDQEGNILAETFTMGGANGEQGPYQTTVDVDPGAGTPFWVMIAESDASGEGVYSWATTASLAA
jgi:hypothetical protein